jgi:hypothetical protein
MIKAVGQMLRRTKVKDVYNKNSKLFKRLQEVSNFIIE